MASFAGRRRAAPAWSIDEASTFAALKEFKLLQFLSTDKKALTTARRLGLSFSHPRVATAQQVTRWQWRRAPSSTGCCCGAGFDDKERSSAT